MAEALDVEVMDLVARMVDVILWAFEEEKTVMINLVLSPIQMQKRRNILAALPIVYKITSLKIEPASVKLIYLSKVRHTASEMP